MKKIQAQHLFPIHVPPIPNGIVVLADDGTILEIANEGTYAKEDLTYYEGIVCPGFVNAHCHLELSYLKGAIPEGNGLIEFIKPIAKIRDTYSDADKQKAIQAAEAEMIKNGIVAVGDISNGTDSFAQKAQGNLRYHTFIEILGLHPEQVATIMEKGQAVLAQVPQVPGATACLAPHAPYTASEQLLHAIDQVNRHHHPNIISIHNQECDAENEMFQKGTGAMVDFYKELGFPIEEVFTAPKMPSINHVLYNLSCRSKTLLVHNTVSTAEDIRLAEYFSYQIYWCFCPNANWYIERKLPNFDLFVEQHGKIVVGTDSLTSNHQLCILSELKRIHQHAPHLPLQDMLKWATLNGAELFGFDKELGSLEVGKCPQLNQLQKVDLAEMLLTEASSITVIS